MNQLRQKDDSSSIPANMSEFESQAAHGNPLADCFCSPMWRGRIASLDTVGADLTAAW
jgi:hypothetical protein